MSVWNRRNAAREGADRLALALAFLAGTIGETLLKLTPLPSGYAAFAAAAWAAAVLFAYALAAHFGRRLRTEPETIGDNCYYLGFVFTLTSLAVTLFQISGAEAGQDALRSVISGFGVALSSTIVGIALRVWLMRMRPDLVARDREARIELYDAMRAFKTNLSDGAGIFKSYAVESVQLIGEQHHRMREMTNELIKNHEVTVRRGAEVHMNALQETIAAGSEKVVAAITNAIEDALQGSTVQFQSEIRAIREDLAGFIQGEAEALRALVASTAAITEGAEGSQARMEAIRERLDALALRLAASSSLTDETLARAVSHMQTTTEHVAKRIETGFGRLADAADAADVTRPAEQLARAAAAIEKPVAALEAAAVRLAEATNALENRPALVLERPIAALEAAAQRVAAAGEALKANPPAFAGSPVGPVEDAVLTSGIATPGRGSSEPPEPRPGWRFLWSRT